MLTFTFGDTTAASRSHVIRHRLPNRHFQTKRRL